MSKHNVTCSNMHYIILHVIVFVRNKPSHLYMHRLEYIKLISCTNVVFLCKKQIIILQHTKCFRAIKYHVTCKMLAMLNFRRLKTIGFLPYNATFKCLLKFLLKPMKICKSEYNGFFLIIQYY